MKKRFGWIGGLLLILSLGMISCSKAKEATSVRFGIVSDLHAPNVPGGRERLESFIEASDEAGVDFIVNLGDFCCLDKKSGIFREIWEGFEKDKYLVLGDQDLYRYSVDFYVEGMDMPGRYYSFDKGNFHFVVLDGNNFWDGEKIRHYDRANYGDYAPESYSYMDKEQMEWLAGDLAATDKKTILFSHQSIDSELKNGDKVREILESENRRVGFKKVVLAFSGHNHTNYTKEINGITYMQINSASYVWVGKPTQSKKRFSKKINKKYPMMAYSMMYDRSLYAIVTLTEEGAEVKGRKANFMPPAPEEIGLKDSLGIYPLVSSIEDAYVRFAD